MPPPRGVDHAVRYGFIKTAHADHVAAGAHHAFAAQKIPKLHEFKTVRKPRSLAVERHFEVALVKNEGVTAHRAARRVLQQIRSAFFNRAR